MLTKINFQNCTKRIVQGMTVTHHVRFRDKVIKWTASCNEISAINNEHECF